MLTLVFKLVLAVPVLSPVFIFAVVETEGTFGIVVEGIDGAVIEGGTGEVGAVNV